MSAPAPVTAETSPVTAVASAIVKRKGNADTTPAATAE